MRALLLAGAAVLVAMPALACRGTAEYPELAAQLAQLDLSAADKAAYAGALEEGAALHQRGHDVDSQALRLESLKILDDIKLKLAQ